MHPFFLPWEYHGLGFLSEERVLSTLIPELLLPHTPTTHTSAYGPFLIKLKALPCQQSSSSHSKSLLTSVLLILASCIFCPAQGSVLSCRPCCLFSLWELPQCPSRSTRAVQHCPLEVRMPYQDHRAAVALDVSLSQGRSRESDVFSPFQPLMRHMQLKLNSVIWLDLAGFSRQ